MAQFDSRWKESRVLVTGGASFIGSNLVDKLVQLGAEVTVVDEQHYCECSSVPHSGRVPIFLW